MNEFKYDYVLSVNFDKIFKDQSTDNEFLHRSCHFFLSKNICILQHCAVVAAAWKIQTLDGVVQCFINNLDTT